MADGFAYYRLLQKSELSVAAARLLLDGGEQHSPGFRVLLLDGSRHCAVIRPHAVYPIEDDYSHYCRYNAEAAYQQRGIPPGITINFPQDESYESG
jgi:hypothetical protein